MDEEIKELVEIIKRYKRPAYLTTNQKHIRIRCPFCGDSKKSKASAHMYIELKPPFRYYCQRCNTGGALTLKALQDFMIYDSEASLITTSLTKKYLKENPNKHFTRNVKMYKLNSEKTDTYQHNKKYLEDRYNIELEDDDIRKFNCVLDFDKFNELNKLNLYYDKKYFDLSSAIGFISSDSSHIVFRDTSGNQERRYYNLALSDDEIESSKVYNIKNSVDLLNDNTEIIITEGIFDIIGVYLHFYKDNMKPNKNYIFAAACGKSYGTVINHYMRMGFLNSDITIYSDADVNIEFYKNLKEENLFIKDSRIKIYYNDLEKDFGIPKDKIKLRMVKI